jgi:hypothetical protein
VLVSIAPLVLTIKTVSKELAQNTSFIGTPNAGLPNALENTTKHQRNAIK